MKPMQLTLRYVVPAILLCATVVAQDTNDRTGVRPAAFEEALPVSVPVQLEGGQKDLRLELVVHRWSDRGAQDERGQRFFVSVKERPAFMENIRWDQGTEIEFAPGEHSKIVTLIFDTTGAGATDQPTQEGKLVLRVEARHEAVIPPQRELEIPLRFKRALQPGNASISVCALREDAPEDFPIERAFEFCDPARQPVLRSDRVVLFFTPGRDLVQPIGEDQYFLMRVMGPNGHQVASKEFWNKGTADRPGAQHALHRRGIAWPVRNPPESVDPP